MTAQKTHTLERSIGIAIHLSAWLYIFSTPLFFGRRGEQLDWAHYLRGIVFPLATCAVFYLNYFWLVPRYVTQHRFRLFFFWNLLLLVAVTASVEFYMTYAVHSAAPARPHPSGGPSFPRFVFVSRAFITFAFSVVVATAIRLSILWRRAEEARREAELGRTEAELKHLKNQISPHFLLNTLNNIYALTAFDSEKAQQAILELSRMLRYLLYENQEAVISLRKEAEFLQTYIALMRLRVARDVDVRFDVSIPGSEAPEVAPLIFISLVENAFKHGISPTRPSFIHMSLTADATSGDLTFTVSNSNYPKSRHDKSGSGIGLQQVSSRLRLAYPDRHSWHYGPSADGRTYRSTICINLRKPRR